MRARTYCTTVNSHGNPVNAMAATFAHLRGWNVGVQVEFAPEDGEDTFRIFTTGGSNNPGTRQHIGTVRLEDGHPVFYFQMED